ncbi:nicotinate-nucleotide--dimethylbenzimidazole phosphoribosyltransferase [Acinetobacter baumannii]
MQNNKLSNINSSTKPTGALGDLKQVQLHLPVYNQMRIHKLTIHGLQFFAGDHEFVVEENISAYPQAVTVKCCKNFTTGGAAN